MSKIFSRDDFDRILSTGVQTEREDDDDEIDQGSFNREKFDQILNGTFDNTLPDVEPTRWEPPKSTQDSTSKSNETEGNIFSKIKNVFKSVKKKYEDFKEVETNYTEEDYQIYSPLALERLNTLNQELSEYEDRWKDKNSNIGKAVFNLVKGEAGILGTSGKDKDNKGGIEAIKDAKNRTWEEEERINRENKDERMTVAAKMEERTMITAFLNRKDVKSGFFDGLKVAVEEGRFIPFLYNQDQAKRKELTLEALQRFQDTDQKDLMNVSETIKKFQGDEELSELDKALVQRMQAEALTSRIDKGIPYGLGESLVDMARYGFEFAALGGLAKGAVSGATKVLPKATKILPKRLAGSFMQKLTTEMTEALVQTGMNAPMLSEKTAEYALPEYEIMTSKDGEMLLKEASQGDDPTTAFKKAFLSSYAEHFSERAGGLIKSGGSSVYKKIVERMGLITENPENFIQKALIGKLISKSSNKSTTVFAKYLRATKFDGVLEEVMEEELNEPVQAMIEQRDYNAPVLTEEGNARLVMEILGIGMYGGLLKIPDKTINTINKWRVKRPEFGPIEIPVDEEANILPDNLPSVVREEIESLQNETKVGIEEEGVDIVDDVIVEESLTEDGFEDMPNGVKTLIAQEVGVDENTELTEALSQETGKYESAEDFTGAIVGGKYPEEKMVQTNSENIELPNEYRSEKERASFVELAKDPEGKVEEYIKRFGSDVNSDSAKLLFKGYNRKNSIEYGKASGKLADMVLNRVMEEKSEEPNRNILMLSGGTGSGKTTTKAMSKGNYTITYDSTLSNYNRAKDYIEKAIELGYEVDIAYIYREPLEAFKNGVIARFEDGRPRTVTINNHLNSHRKARKVAVRLYEEYIDNPNVNIVFRENTLQGTREIDVEYIKSLSFNKKDLNLSIKNYAKQLLETGRITEQQYKSFLGGKEEEIGRGFRKRDREGERKEKELSRKNEKGGQDSTSLGEDIEEEQPITLIGGKGSLDNKSAERRDGEEQVERKTNSTKGLTPTQEDIPSNTDIKLSIIDQLSNELSVVLDVDLGVERWGTDEEGYKWVGVHAKYPSWLPEYLHKKDAIGKALEKLGSPKTISLRKGSNAEEVYKEIRKEAVNRYREEVRKYGEEADTYSGSGEASVGMFATEEELLKKISNDVPPAIQMPEMVSIYRQLTDGNIVEVRHRMGNKLGFHQAGRIAIKGDLFIDEEQATKTLAHELGHLVDFLPDNTMKRGNLLGRIASLNSFLKGKLVSKEVADKVDVLVKEREGYQKERKKIKEMRVEMGTGANAYKNEDRYFYKKIREVNKKIDELQKDAIANKAITSELRALTMLWKPFDPSMNETFTNYRYSGKELYADAISVLFVRPDLLKTKAPKFWTAFWQYLNNKPDVMQAVLETYDILYKGKDAIGSERNKKLMDMFNKGEEVATAKIAEIQDSKVGYLFLTKYLFLDKNAAVIDKINELKKRGTNLSPQENPIYALEGNNYLDSKIKAYLEKFITPVDKRLEKAKLTWNDLGELLFLERVRDERGGVVDLVDMIEEQLPEVSQNIIETLSDVLGKPVYEQYTILQDTLPVETWNQIKEILPAGIANPQGYTTTTARDQINYLKSNYEPARWEQLTKAKEEFRASVKEVNRRAREAGYYTEDIQNLIESNESYATFQVLDYLELYISPQVYGQKGTFKDVANPAVSTIIKNMSVLSAIERNETKKKLVGMLLREFPDEVTLAQVKQNGKRQQIIDTRSPGLGTIKLIVNGKLQGYYVDKYIANTVNVMRNDVLTAFSSILSMPNKIYRPLFTSLNLGFQSFNFVRDFTRYWKNMPDASIGEALTSLPRAFYRYAQAVPHAWGRASNKPDKLIREMDELGILGTTYNDIFNNPDKADQQIDRILIKADLKSLSPKQKQKIFIVPFAKALNVVEIFGNFIETLPKVAGYKELKGKMPDEQLVSFLRTRVGSPDFRRGGAATPITNNIFLFSNAIKEGWRADLASLKDPTTRSGLVWKTMLITIFPKLLMFLVTKGLLGDELEKMMRDASEYDKSNYIMIPLGRTEEGKTQFLRVPQDETGRFIGGLFWKTLTTISSEELELNDIFQLLDYGAGQFPSVSPIYTGAGAVISYLSGRNPYDAFRGRYVIPDDEFEAGAKYSFPIFMDWLIKNQGAGIVLPNFSAYKNDAMSGLEKVLNAPMLANTLGRWIRVTDQGTREEAYEPVLEERQQKAVEKLEREESMENYIKLYLKSDKSESNKNYYINQFLEEQLGNPPYKGTVKAQATNYRKSFMKELFARSGKNELASLKSLGSNAEKKAYINSVKNNMSKEEFEIFLEEALENKFISELLRAEF